MDSHETNKPSKLPRVATRHVIKRAWETQPPNIGPIDKNVEEIKRLLKKVVDFNEESRAAKKSLEDEIIGLKLEILELKRYLGRRSSKNYSNVTKREIIYKEEQRPSRISDRKSGKSSIYYSTSE